MTTGRAFEAVASVPWAMTPESVEQIALIADRKHDVSEETIKALEAERGQPMQRGERVRIRDGVAVLDVSGPLFKRANIFTAISGATSYDVLMRDLQVALADASVHSIMLLIDSPGGEANGCDELAAAVYAARGKKPVTAFVSGQACSGAYWLAAACSRIVVSDAAIVGSIGVVLGLRDTSEADKRNGVRKVEFVSSQSPGKRPDIATDEGRARIQTLVDDLAAVFISAVAKYRGVSVETVVEKFGNGGVVVGAAAVARGMADAVGSTEAEISALIQRAKARNRYTGGLLVSDQTDTPAVDADKIAADARAAAQARMKGIIECADGVAYPATAKHLAFDTDVSADVAKGILAAVAKDCTTIVSAAEIKPAAAATPAAAQDEFAQAKATAGALGAGPEPKPQSDAAANGWSRAVANANASRGLQ